jgi:hypothetical protein
MSFLGRRLRFGRCAGLNGSGSGSDDGVRTIHGASSSSASKTHALRSAYWYVAQRQNPNDLSTPTQSAAAIATKA